MEKNSLVILLLTFSCLLSLALCRPIVEKSKLDIKTDAAVEQSKLQVPAAGGTTQPQNIPWPHWEYSSSPTDGPRWRFVYPPIRAVPGFTFPRRSVPWPHWELVQPPVASGSRWTPRDLPHWRFVQPRMPAGGSTPAAAAPAVPAA